MRILALLALIPSLAVAQYYDEPTPAYRPRPVEPINPELLRPAPNYWEIKRQMQATNDDYYQQQMLREQKRQNELLEQQIYQQEYQEYLRQYYKHQRDH